MESKYPKFRWHRAWVEYTRTLPESQQLALMESIAHYGLYDEEPKGLDDDVLAYFNEIIRPNLDRQHKGYIKRQQAKSSKL